MHKIRVVVTSNIQQTQTLLNFMQMLKIWERQFIRITQLLQECHWILGCYILRLPHNVPKKFLILYLHWFGENLLKYRTLPNICYSMKIIMKKLTFGYEQIDACIVQKWLLTLVKYVIYVVKWWRIERGSILTDFYVSYKGDVKDRIYIGS